MLFFVQNYQDRNEVEMNLAVLVFCRTRDIMQQIKRYKKKSIFIDR